MLSRSSLKLLITSLFFQLSVSEIVSLMLLDFGPKASASAHTIDSRTYYVFTKKFETSLQSPPTRGVATAFTIQQASPILDYQINVTALGRDSVTITIDLPTSTAIQAMSLNILLTNERKFYKGTG